MSDNIALSTDEIALLPPIMPTAALLSPLLDFVDGKGVTDFILRSLVVAGSWLSMNSLSNVILELSCEVNESSVGVFFIVKSTEDFIVADYDKNGEQLIYYRLKLNQRAYFFH